MYSPVTFVAQGYGIVQFKPAPDYAPPIKPKVRRMVNLQIIFGVTGLALVVILCQPPLAYPSPPRRL
jgi:hypothetical protein